MNKKSTIVPKTIFLLLLLTSNIGLRLFAQEVSHQNTFNKPDKRTIGSTISEKNDILNFLTEELNQFLLDNPMINQVHATPTKIISNDEKSVKWKKHTNEKGAFSVKLPGDPVDISRDAPNPMDEEGEPYHLNMYTANDTKKNNLYLVRYNDMPNGYYLNDKQAGFSSIQDNLEGKAILVGEPKEIRIGAIEGREIEILVQGKYHAFMRIYIRGNRIYVLMAQKMNATDKISIDNEFFKSFKIEDYAYIEPIKYQPKPNDFEVSLFDNVKITTDTVGYESTSIKHSKNYYSINPSSGGLYQLNHGDLQDYVQIKDLKAFYDSHIQLYTEWNDSLISKKDITIDGKPGVTFILENKNTRIPERHQLWLDNNRLFVMTAYLSKEEQENPISDKIFNSFRYDSTKEQPFDRTGPKTDLLLKDLHSLDSLTLQRALGAFDYYEFEQSDLPKLYQALKETYKDTLYASTIKEAIINVFESTHDDTTIKNLKTLYTTTFKNDDEMKAMIISTMPMIKEDSSIEVYKELLTKSPPTSIKDYGWQILAPIRDSIPFVVDNFELITSLMEHEMYRYSVLDLSTELTKVDSEKKDLVINHQADLLKFAIKDLDLYINSLNDSLVDSYNYTSLINAYLSLFNESAINSNITDDFTKKIIGLKDNNWLKNQAITARIKSNQSLDKPMVNRLIDSLFYRFEIMKAYHDTGQFDKVPDIYKQSEAFSELSLHFILSEDDYEPESFQIMGKIEKHGLLYYAYKVKYDEGEESLTSYITAVGPIKDVSAMTTLELYEIFTEWEQLDYANWEIQAEKLIPDESDSDN